MMASVFMSTFAVASSRSRRRVGLSTARARQISCLSPTEKFEPASATTASSPPTAFTASPSCADSSASQTSASVHSWKGSRFFLTDPAKRAGSCGMSVKARRRSRRGSEQDGTPSTRIVPEVGAMRSSAAIRDDFPAPVRPTTPTLLPGAMLRVTPCSTATFGSAYQSRTFLNSSAPAAGTQEVLPTSGRTPLQPSHNPAPGQPTNSSSRGNLPYSWRRSTAVSWFSNSAD
mmetsp:Transcript_29430/g.77127  ORF Transcript_29430/g.77127 Transcript_29430/m.77127 type:complete len:231 (-) Transcript_29430:3396-4088(-)